MAKDEDNLEELLADVTATKQDILLSGEDDPIALIEKVYQIWWRWADFHIYVIDPTLSVIDPARVIPPEPLEGSTDVEFVYPIVDQGFQLSTSKGEELFTAGLSMCKMYYTIEKIISILIERLKASGVDMEAEIKVSFGGHELCQRKAFESIINLPYNVVVTNFEPGTWGESYLATVKRMADKGYGFPSETPRDNYRQPLETTTKPKR